ncbi:hypothetical protein I6N90_21170 [Paenibacillus sp. GSMTC-2017]|uniref:hypothetical protein n=1 Tax=Paenibacillus sp. GSMTC-2017 TaxID=2794350 RepID=UPI0018D7880A|nr:hypothetical protein [Paenibacillus sp. GSMTC-2017]MBH5320306.1 hypothetical protein [Paenibacillus sp. GSMTC-2017]
MSQFSQSFHLKTIDRTQAVELIRDAGKWGYVYPEVKGWVSFVVENRRGNADEIISQSNPSILVHYVFFEDHMWTLKIYNKDELVFDYEADWAGEGLVIEKRLFDLEILSELIMQEGNRVDDLEQIFDFKDDKIDYDNPPAYLIAQRLGLQNFDWISIEYSDSLDDSELEEMGIVAVE